MASLTTENGGLPIGFVGVGVDNRANEMLVEMKSLTLVQTVNRERFLPTDDDFFFIQAVLEVTTMITSAIDGSGATTGTEISEADFLVLIQEFITETESLTSSKITSLALTIVQAKVIRREVVLELECE